MRRDRVTGAGDAWPHLIAAAEVSNRFSSDGELRQLLDSLMGALRASGALLTLQVDGNVAPLEIGRAGKLTLSDEDWAMVAAIAPGAPVASRDDRAGTDASDWIPCLINRRAWQVLRVPVGSRRGRSQIIASFLFRNPAAADRELVNNMVQQMGALIEGYFRLWQRSRVQAATAAGLRSALDLVDMGVVLLDRSSKVSFANAAAGAMLAEADHLRLAGDLLIPTDVNDAVRLQVAINHALAASNALQTGDGIRAPVLKLRPAKSERALLLCIFPCAEPAIGPDEPALMLFLLDPNREFDEQLQPVCKLYGLSPVETRLVCLITGGAALQQAATAMRIKEQTARSYLKMIFMKTETKRQADLVRLMLCSLVRTKSGLALQVVE